MPSEAVTQAAFLAALADGPGAIPAGLVGPDGTADAQRFQVYRNTVASTLIDALAASFPAVVRLVGEEFFAAAAADYAAREKPASPLLFRYGGAFPDHLAGIESLAAYPYVPDVARLDLAWLGAYHAADAEAFGPEHLARMPEERLADLCLALHPATRVVASPHPVVTLWAANRGDGPMPERLPDEGEDALVTRPGIEVLVLRLPPGCAAFLGALDTGHPLGNAAAEAAAHPGFDLGASLAVLLRTGALCPAPA